MGKFYDKTNKYKQFLEFIRNSACFQNNQSLPLCDILYILYTIYTFYMHTYVPCMDNKNHFMHNT